MFAAVFANAECSGVGGRNLPLLMLADGSLFVVQRRSASLRSAVAAEAGHGDRHEVNDLTQLPLLLLVRLPAFAPSR